MISNYYFESLVLLKNELCMDWADLYVPPTKVKDRLKIFNSNISKREKLTKQLKALRPRKLHCRRQNQFSKFLSPG